MKNATCQNLGHLQPSLRDSKQCALPFPAMNCWAILTHPSGMFPDSLGGIFQLPYGRRLAFDRAHLSACAISPLQSLIEQMVPMQQCRELCAE
jgi:hypothetical protein